MASSSSSSDSANLVDVFNTRAKATMSPRVHLKDLKPKRKYKIAAFKEVSVPKTGRAVIAIIEVPEKSGEGELQHDCFLPRRFTSILTPERIEEYNKNPDLCLRYLGIGDHREFIVKLIK